MQGSEESRTEGLIVVDRSLVPNSSAFILWWWGVVWIPWNFAKRFIHTFQVCAVQNGTYNSKMTHSAHDLTPEGPTRKENHLKVEVKLETDLVKNRTFPNIQIGYEIKLQQNGRCWKRPLVKLEQRQIKYKVPRIENILGNGEYSLKGSLDHTIWTLKGEDNSPHLSVRCSKNIWSHVPGGGQ